MRLLLIPQPFIITDKIMLSYRYQLKDGLGTLNTHLYSSYYYDSSEGKKSQTQWSRDSMHLAEPSYFSFFQVENVFFCEEYEVN